MLSTQMRHLMLAQAAIQHAIYFLELEAHAKVASYLQYAAEQFNAIAQDEQS
ncbi:MAG: hypothetical protein VKJ64_02235 [Leptolyngbyaceae bacterium]|nr:hypothetical protein [Leptolyngbyaceae bacterium]